MRNEEQDRDEKPGDVGDGVWRVHRRRREVVIEKRRKEEVGDATQEADKR